jgi:tetratricopeptide (TPR) repeat protein
VYARSLFCGFVRDDFSQIVNNRQVQSWEYLPQLLGSHLWSQNGVEWSVLFYRPLFSVWMLLVHTIGGLSPWFWHLSSIFLHVIATYLVFLLCRRLTQHDVGAAAASVIFAVYPIHVDAVTWVSASCEVLFAIFVLAAMLALVPGDGRGGDIEGANRRLWISALWFAAGLFAKETAIALLPVLLLLAWLQSKRRARPGGRLWMLAAPYAAVTAVYLFIRWVVLLRSGVGAGEHSWAKVVFSAPSIFLFYLKKLFLPWNLSGCYENALIAAPGIGFWLPLLAILLALAAVTWFAIRYDSLSVLAGALIVMPVLPALAVIRIYPQGDLTHDRYLYVSTIGVALLAAIVVRRLWTLERRARVAMAAVVFGLIAAGATGTFFQQRYYQDNLAFYSRALDVNPRNGFALAMLGNVYLDEGRVDAGLEELQKAHEIAPDNQKVTVFLSQGLVVAGKYRDAEEVLMGLLQGPNLSVQRTNTTLLSLANLEIGLGELEQAQQRLQRIEQSDNRLPQLHWAWGVLYEKQGLLPQALAAYQKEVQITGDALAQERSSQIARLIYAHPIGGASSKR